MDLFKLAIRLSVTTDPLTTVVLTKTTRDESGSPVRTWRLDTKGKSLVYHTTMKNKKPQITGPETKIDVDGTLISSTKLMTYIMRSMSLGIPGESIPIDMSFLKEAGLI